MTVALTPQSRSRNPFAGMERKRRDTIIVALLFLLAIVYPIIYPSVLARGPLSGIPWPPTLILIQCCVFGILALGLNIVMGFAGLLDLGYVAFYAIGAYMVGYFASGFWNSAGGGEGIHVLVSEPASNLPGIHLNFLIILVIAVVATTIAGMLIGLPTLRLRGDYIAIVTLAFGEIIGRIAINSDEGIFGIGDFNLTNGRAGITPVDKIDLPFVDRFTTLDLRPWYFTALALALFVIFINFRLRDSRIGRAWIAIREDEVAAVSMGIPTVRVKLLAYAIGAALGGMAGSFLASYINVVNADQFEFSFSIFVLAMIILGGLGSIWGVVVGALALSFINTRLIPDVFNTVPSKSCSTVTGNSGARSGAAPITASSLRRPYGVNHDGPCSATTGSGAIRRTRRRPSSRISIPVELTCPPGRGTTPNRRQSSVKAKSTMFVASWRWIGGLIGAIRRFPRE